VYSVEDDLAEKSGAGPFQLPSRPLVAIGISGCLSFYEGSLTLCLFAKPLLRLVNQSCSPNDACVVDESGRTTRAALPSTGFVLVSASTSRAVALFCRRFLKRDEDTCRPSC
jgi:hypothetical protein